MSWYASVLEEKIYKCVSFIDLYDRSVVAGENSSIITSSPAVRTLEKALSSAKAIPQNLILHSNQGSRFTSAEFVQHCRELGISQSMSRAGCPYDDAPMERDHNTFGIIRYAHTRITDI
ncbi:MAG: DDE-type integrase/transposase/recombinase [Stomatobaculum longum]|nr:DDE-type integrase/transposase/recombinase [Stomatobaculum longum]